MSKIVNGFIRLENVYGTDFTEDELKAIVSAAYDLFKEIQDLLPDRFPKRVIEREINLGDRWDKHPVRSKAKGIEFQVVSVFINVRKSGVSYYVSDNYISDNSGTLSAGELYLYLQNKERILNFVKECKIAWEQAVNEEMKIFSSTSPNKESANSYFEKVFHNTGKTLKSVVKDMQNKGYSKSDIVSAILNVLGDVNWED